MTIEIQAASLRGYPLPDPGAGTKEARGSALVVAGSVEVPGAAILAGTAALRAGAGKLQMSIAAGTAPHAALAVPEALVVRLPEGRTAMSITGSPPRCSCPAPSGPPRSWSAPA